jgi:hypothetical protein
MSWSRLLLTCIVVSVLAWPASAGIFFHRQPKPKPEVRVPELLVIVKSDKDDRKRASAAAELRQYDLKLFPDIVPILVDVVHNDARAGVRYEAAVSLSRLRPVSQEAGMALEYAAAHDAAFYVRMQARTSLVYYRLSGYHTPKQMEPARGKKGANKGEPPLAEPEVVTKNGRQTPVPKSAETSSKTIKPVKVQPLPDPTIPRRLPQGPAKSPLVPADPPRLEKPPVAVEEGPPLVPQQ